MARMVVSMYTTDSMQVDPTTDAAATTDGDNSVVPTTNSADSVASVAHSRSQPRRRTGEASFTANAVVRTFTEATFIPPVEELQAELEQVPCVMIDGGCGLGKSTRIRELLELYVKESPDTRILMLSVRVIHALNIRAEFDTGVLKPVCYLDGDRGDFLNNNFVVLSWEQANMLQYSPKPFDIVILDEVRTGLDKVKYRSTLKSMDCLKAIWDVASHAQKLIVADADCRFDNVVPFWLDTLSIKHTVWHVPYRRLKRTLRVEFYGKIDREEHIMAAFRDAIRELADGEKLLVVTATRKAAMAYARYCSERSIKYVKYDGKSGTNKLDFQDPDAAWNDVQVVIYNTCVTVGIDPKRTTFKEIFMHTSYHGANWLSMFQAVSRGNRHCGDQMFTIHVLLTCKRPEIDILERRVDGEAAAEATYAGPTLNRARADVDRASRARRSVADEACTDAHQAVQYEPVSGLNELRALVELTDQRHKNGLTHFSEFQKCAAHQGWAVELAEPSGAGEMEALFPDVDMDEQMLLTDGVRLLADNMMEQMNDMECASEHTEYIQEFLSVSTVRYDHSNKGEAGYVDTHQRSVFDVAAADLYYLLRELHVPRAYECICDLDVLKKHGPSARRLAQAVYLSRREVSLVAALSLSNETEHVDTGGRASESLNAHECWRVFCDVMGIDGRSLRSCGAFCAPDGVVDVLNREHRKEALLGEDYRLKDRLLNAASLVGSTPGTMWKAVQKISRQFGLKPEKAKVMIDGTRNCFGSVGFSLSPETLRLVDACTIYDRRCAPHRRIPVIEWNRHCEALDSDTAERCYEEQVQASLSLVEQGSRQHTVVPGSTLEVVSLEKLNELLAREKPAALNAEQSRAWDADMNRLNEMLATGDEGEDGTLSYTTTYRRNHTVGRDVAVNSLRSLQGCPKKYRGELAAEYFHDLDMENCHYMLMVQIADAHDVDLKCVRYYVDNRDDCLQTVRQFYGVTRKAAKDLFLSVLNGGAPGAWMRKFDVDSSLRRRLFEGYIEHLGIVKQLQGEYETIRSVMFGRYSDNVGALIDEIKRDEPRKPQRWVHENMQRRELPAESEEAFEARVKRSAFSNLLQNEERLCLDAMVEKLAEMGYDVGCKIYDGSLVRRKQCSKLPKRVIAECEGHIKAETGFRVRLWEKCLMCGEKLADCKCEGAQQPCLDCGEVYARCTCDDSGAG